MIIEISEWFQQNENWIHKRTIEVPDDFAYKRIEVAVIVNKCYKFKLSNGLTIFTANASLFESSYKSVMI